MAKMKIAKRTYDRNVRRFARIRTEAWEKFTDFADRRCRLKKEREKSMDELVREVVDSFVDLNTMIYNWCIRNGVEVSDFIRDVEVQSLCDAFRKCGASRKEKRNGKEE